MVPPGGRASCDRHVDVTARAGHQRKHARGHSQFQCEGGVIAEPKLGPLGENEGQFAVSGSNGGDPSSEPCTSRDRECLNCVGRIAIRQGHADVDTCAAGNPDPRQLGRRKEPGRSPEREPPHVFQLVSGPPPSELPSPPRDRLLLTGRSAASRLIATLVRYTRAYPHRLNGWGSFPPPSAGEPSSGARTSE